MGLRFIYGTAGTGKSTFCFNEIKNNKDIIKVLYHYTKDNYIQKMKKILFWIYSIVTCIRKV